MLCQMHLGRKEKKMFKAKNSRHFKTPSNQPSLGDRLLHEGEATSDPAKIQSCCSSHFFNPKWNLSLADTHKALPCLEFLSKMNSCDDIIDNFSVEESEGRIQKLKTKLEALMTQSEHLKHGGPLLTLWLKWIFCTFAQVPPSLLTGIICPIYEGKGPLVCNS